MRLSLTTSFRDLRSSSDVRIRLMAATRGFLGAGLPFLVLNFAGLESASIFALLGGLNTAIADAGGEYRSRLFGMSLVLFVMPVVLFCGMQVHTSWLQAILLCLVAILGGFARALGATGTSIGLVGGIVFLVGTQLAAPPAEAISRAMFYAGGAAWAIAVSLLLWWLRPYRRIRQEVAGCLEATAHLLEVSSRRRAGGQRGQDRDRIVAEDYRRVRQTIEQARLSIGELQSAGANDKVIADLIIILRASSRIAALGIGLREMRHTAHAEDVSDEALGWLDEAVKAVAQECRTLAEDLLTSRHEAEAASLFDGLDSPYQAPGDRSESPQLQQMIAVPYRMRQHLSDALEVLGRLLDTPPRVPPILPTRRPAQILRSTLATLGAHLNGRSLIFRHALRVGVATGGGIIIAHRLQVPHPIWIPLTTLVVLQPNFGGTWTRAIGRTIGTIIGAVLAGALLLTLPGSLTIALAIAFLTFAAFLFFPRKYATGVVFITALIILLLSEVTPGEWTNVIGRVIDTLIGTGIALAVGFVLWPIWDRHQMPEQIARALRRLKDYSEALLTLLATGTSGNDQSLPELKRQVEIEITNTDAMFQRIRLEPRASRADLYRHFALLTQMQRLHRHLTALSSTMEIDPGPRPAFEPAAKTVPPALAALATAVEKDQAPEGPDLIASSIRTPSAQTTETRAAPTERLVDRIVSDVDALRTIGR